MALEHLWWKKLYWHSEKSLPLSEKKIETTQNIRDEETRFVFCLCCIFKS